MILFIYLGPTRGRESIYNDKDTRRRGGKVILFIYLGPTRGRESIYMMIKIQGDEVESDSFHISRTNSWKRKHIQ